MSDHRRFYSHGRVAAMLYRLDMADVRRKLEGTDLSPAQAEFLHVVSRLDGPLQNEIAEALCVSKPAVAQTVKALEEKGLVERVADKDDARARRVRLTAASRELEPCFNAAFDEVIARQRAALTSEENCELERLLCKLVESLERQEEGERDYGRCRIVFGL